MTTVQEKYSKFQYLFNKQFMIFWIFCTLINIFSHYSRKLPELEMPIVPLMTTLLALFTVSDPDHGGIYGAAQRGEID